MSISANTISSPLSLHDARRLNLACRLLLADGVIRRVEEWCGKEPPLLSRGWAGKVSPMEMRRQIGNVIAVTLPRDISWRLFKMLYARPLFPAESGQPAQHIQLPDISFLASEMSPPLEVLFSQTGFPHSILAAWFLALHYPLFDDEKNLHPIWATFYMHQLLEWHIRLVWLMEVMPEIEHHKLDYPMNIFDGRFPFPEALGYQPHHIMHFCHMQDTTMDFDSPSTPIHEYFYVSHWFRRSMHPLSPYQRAIIEVCHDRPPKVSERFRDFPHIEQRFQLFVEQRGVLMYFGPLRPLFAATASEHVLTHLLSPFAAAAWLDTCHLLPPDTVSPETVDQNLLGM